MQGTAGVIQAGQMAHLRVLRHGVADLGRGAKACRGHQDGPGEEHAPAARGRAGVVRAGNDGGAAAPDEIQGGELLPP